MNKMFSRKIFQNLKEGKSISLGILLEEKDDDIFDKMDDEESSDEESSDEESSDEDSASDIGGGGDDDVDDTESLDSGDSGDVTKAQFEDLVKNLENIKKLILKTTDQKGTGGIEAFIGSTVAKDLSKKSLEVVSNDDLKDLGESISRILSKSRINNFLFEGDDDPSESIEDDIDNLDRILNKGTELVDTFKKGHDIDIQSYVSASINAYKNFENLFSKEEIIKQATINVIVLNSGSKAEANVKEFEELFHEELHKNFGIEYDEYALITKKNKTAAGAKSQG